MSDSPSPKIFPVGWDELHKNARALGWRLSEKGPFKGMVAVTRGGLVPACIVARELGIRVIDTICAVNYEEGEDLAASPNPDDETVVSDQVRVLKAPSNVGEGEGWLVLDDLVDTGRTFAYLRKLMPKAHYATVYAKPMGKPMVQTFVTEVSQDTWIVFPWENAELGR